MKNDPGNAEHQFGKSNDKEKAKLELGVPRWYSRGYLPHLDDITKIQSITFRLADSLPQDKLEVLEEQLKLMPEVQRNLVRRKTIEGWLDAGMGCCALRHPEVAGTVQNALLKFDGDRYRLLAWCVMPNHVHVLIQPRERLGKIVQSWKSFTGRWAMLHNARLELGVPGERFWMREYWDRYVRNEDHFMAVVNYIHENPVAAGLCAKAEEWPWSSARYYPGNAEHQLGNFKSTDKAELELGAPRKTN